MKKTNIHFNKHILEVELDRFYDLSIPVRRKGQVNAYDLPDAQFNTFSTEGFPGRVREGGSCNCDEIYLIPHANGTHTECVGHISVEAVRFNECVKKHFFSALLVTVEPEVSDGVLKIHRPMLEAALLPWQATPEALIVRTLPNSTGKTERRYAGKTPPFFTKNSIDFLNESGIKHLLTDLPSVDAEEDTKLTAHHTFWQYPENTQREKTITELIYVPDNIQNGYFWLNLQTIPLETDAVPSRPLIFPARIVR